MKKLLRCLLLLLVGFSSIGSHAGNTEVNVTNPGSLRDLMADLSVSRIDRLTITGELNGMDISYLVSGAGKMANIDSLDISQITLVGDNQPYKTLLVDRSDIGFGTTTEIYYLSETDTIISESHDTGMGGVSSTQHVFCKDLSGAFAENSSFKYVVIPQNITKVANYMFYKNSSVESVKLPSNAMAFGKKVFERAAELKTVNIPDGIKEIPEKTFRNTSIETLHIPSSVEVIGDWAFGEVPVKNIDLSNVKVVGDYAFYGNQITGVLDLSSLESVGFKAFQSSDDTCCNGIILSDRLKEIPDYAFAGLGFEEVSVPDGVVRIGEGAFYACANLISVNIPGTVLEISENSFSETPWFDNLQGDNGVIYVGTIALRYDRKNAPKDSHFSFREGTTVIANSSSYGRFFPTSSPNWKMESVALPSSLKRIGARVFSDCKDLQAIDLPDELEEIGEGSFERCSSLKSISVPAKVKEIPDKAFMDCGKLESVIIPRVERIGEYAFSGDANLYECELPESLKSIGTQAFRGCKMLVSLTLPENLKSIGEEAFRECHGLENVIYKCSDLEEVGNNVFRYYSEPNKGIYKVVVAKNVISLPDWLFSSCKGLTRLIFEDIESSSLKSIGERCFYLCDNLVVDMFPLSLESIGSFAFGETRGFTGDFDLKNIGYVGYSAFSGCDGITSLTISNREVWLGGSAFGECENLKTVKILSETVHCWDDWGSWYYPFSKSKIESVEIGASLQRIPDRMFAFLNELSSLVFEDRGDEANAKSLVIEKDAFRGNGLDEVIFPQGTRCIGENAFCGSGSLMKVVIPDGCDSIGAQAFGACEKLNDIKIGEGLKHLGDLAFSSCRSLESLILPYSCKEIGWKCFDVCYALRALTLLPEVPPVFGGELGYGFDATIYVPGQSLDAYKDVDVLAEHVIMPIPGTEPSEPGDSVDGISSEGQEIRITVKDGNIEISGKDRTVNVRVIDVDGTIVYETNDDKICNLPGGIYILNIGDKKFKVIV